MTNKEIKKYRGIFKKLKIPIYIENFFEYHKPLEIWNIRLEFKDNLDTHIVFDFLDNGICEFDLIFKGDLVDTNCKIGFKSNYFRLFNRVCKNSYKFEIIRDKKLEYNLCKLFNILEINHSSIDGMILLTEILINNYITGKYVNYMWNYDIVKYNQKIIDKRVQRYEKMLEKSLYTYKIYYSIMKDKIIDETERLYLLEKYYFKGLNFKEYLNKLDKDNN